ncbi:hypothetical protein IOCL2690_000517100 [Leishmania lindenbergi]|uniref:Uncharacterized protein n=1 Tax=Leishmania lindenbergi TaxID=651832 RepID=A0AAW3A9I3_9TRYP
MPCSDSAAASLLFAPLSPFRPFVAAEALYTELCLCFWEYCRCLAEVLSLCAVSRPDLRGSEEVSACATAAEALAIAGAVEWHNFSCYASDRLPPSKPSYDSPALTAAECRATSPLLPLM